MLPPQPLSDQDCVVAILSHLDARSLLVAGDVCREWRQCAYQEGKHMPVTVPSHITTYHLLLARCGSDTLRCALSPLLVNMCSAADTHDVVCLRQLLRGVTQDKVYRMR